jgi:hypothetical protein
MSRCVTVDMAFEMFLLLKGDIILPVTSPYHVTADNVALVAIANWPS